MTYLVVLVVIFKLDFNGEEYFEKVLFLNQLFSVFKTWTNEKSVDLKFWILNSLKKNLKCLMINL